MTLTVNSGQITGTLNNFPVFVNTGDAAFTDGSPSFWDGIEVSGNQIQNLRVFTHNGQECAIDLTTTGTDADELHFKAPSIKDGDVFHLYLIPGATRYANNATYGAQKVWLSTGAGSYRTVHHYEKTDSTSNAFNFTDDLAPTTSSAGKLGHCVTFNGTDDGWKMATDANWDTPLQNSSFTVSWWGKIASGGVLHGPTRNYVLSTNRYGYRLYWNAANYFFGRQEGNTTNYSTNPASTQSLSTWYLSHFTYNKATGAAKIWRNASSVGTATFGTGDVVYKTGGPTYDYGSWIGVYTSTGTYSYYAGTMDELRVIGAVLSDEWIAAEYNNQNAPASFYDAVRSVK